MESVVQGGGASVLCSAPGAPLKEGAENEMAAQAGDTNALRTWSPCVPRWGWCVWWRRTMTRPSLLPSLLNPMQVLPLCSTSFF